MSDRASEYLSQLNFLRNLTPIPANSQHVTIIGAGMSGLSSAYELSALGYKVTILEADSYQIGGRVRTLRAPGAPDNKNLYAEVGAMRIPKGHSLTHFYIDELDLPLRKFVQSNDRTWAHIRGKRVRRSEKGLSRLKSQFNLTEIEKSMSADDMWAKAVGSVLTGFTPKEAKDLFSLNFQTDKLKALDKMSLIDGLQAANLSKEAIEYVTSVYGVSTYLNSAFTEHLREEADRVWIDGFDEVIGGTDLLPQKMYEAIKHKVTLIQGAYVNRVKRRGNQLVTFYNNKNKKVVSDWVICTVPLGALLRIDLSHVTTKAQDMAIRQISYDSSTKVIVKCKKRFWELEDGIYGGGSIWDDGLGHTWYPSDNAENKNKNISMSPSYLLASYTWGQHAKRIDALHQQELKPYVINELQKIHPNLDENDISSVIRWSWANYSLSAGAFSFFNPSEHTNYYQDLKTSDDGFMFAGEHCSLNHSWIQGALESTVDVVQKIHNKLI